MYILLIVVLENKRISEVIGLDTLERAQFYVKDENDYYNDVNLPRKLLKLQLPHANEGIWMVLAT